MLRLLFWGGLIVVVWLLARERLARMRRRWRGEPEPVQEGPRTVTLVLIAIGLVYGLAIGYRLFVGDHALFY